MAAVAALVLVFPPGRTYALALRFDYARDPDVAAHQAHLQHRAPSRISARQPAVRPQEQVSWRRDCTCGRNALSLLLTRHATPQNILNFLLAIRTMIPSRLGAIKRFECILKFRALRFDTDDRGHPRICARDTNYVRGADVSPLMWRSISRGVLARGGGGRSVVRQAASASDRRGAGTLWTTSMSSLRRTQNGRVRGGRTRRRRTGSRREEGWGGVERTWGNWLFIFVNPPESDRARPRRNLRPPAAALWQWPHLSGYFQCRVRAGGVIFWSSIVEHKHHWVVRSITFSGRQHAL